MEARMTIMDAAQALVASIQHPAIGHAIWVGTHVNDEGQFVHTINMSVRPAYKSKIQVPKEFPGYPVVEVPWPKGA
jgi:hypothetical protein